MASKVLEGAQDSSHPRRLEEPLAWRPRYLQPPFVLQELDKSAVG